MKLSKNIYSKIALGGLLFGFLSLNAPAQKKNSPSLCQADEQIIWSCRTTKNKIASVCASKDLAEDKGYLQYRFGVSGKIELEFPKDREDSQKAFRYSRYTRPLVTMLTLSFTSGGVVYELHDDDNSEEKPPVRASFIEILNDGKSATIQCSLPATGSLMKLEDIVLQNEEN